MKRHLEENLRKAHLTVFHWRFDRGLSAEEKTRRLHRAAREFLLREDEK